MTLVKFNFKKKFDEINYTEKKTIIFTIKQAVSNRNIPTPADNSFTQINTYFTTSNNHSHNYILISLLHTDSKNFIYTSTIHCTNYLCQSHFLFFL